MAVEIGVTAATVREWRGKFAAEGMAGLEDGVRVGRPKADLVLSDTEHFQPAHRSGDDSSASVQVTGVQAAYLQPELKMLTERDQLIRWARRAKTAQYLALRARIVLRCAGGGTNKQAAAELGVDASTVDRWRGRFIELVQVGL